MAQLTFDATTVAPSSERGPIPKGKWLGQIIRSEMKNTKSGSGSYLELEIEFLDNALPGRKIWDRLNLDNPNEQAVSIARRTLSAICHAVGVMAVTDSEELHFKPLMVSVGPRRDDPEQTEVKGYSSHGGALGADNIARPARVSGVGHTAQAMAEAQMTAAAGNANKPWRK
jgi:hypothetical protein